MIGENQEEMTCPRQYEKSEEKGYKSQQMKRQKGNERKAKSMNEDFRGKFCHKVDLFAPNELIVAL